jgi:hypothetical protein
MVFDAVFNIDGHLESGRENPLSLSHSNKKSREERSKLICEL